METISIIINFGSGPFVFTQLPSGITAYICIPPECTTSDARTREWIEKRGNGAKCVEMRPDGRYVWPFDPKN
jgi:hypothetical protein